MAELRPLLDTLNPRARQAFPIISRAVREGLSANATQAILQEAGLGIRRQSLLDIYRGIQESETFASRLRFNPLDRTLDLSQAPLAVSRTARRFTFQVRVDFLDLTSGRLNEAFVTVSSSTPLSRRQLEADALDMASLGSVQPDVEFRGAVIERAMQAGLSGTIL